MIPDASIWEHTTGIVIGVSGASICWFLWNWLELQRMKGLQKE